MAADGSQTRLPSVREILASAIGGSNPQPQPGPSAGPHQQPQLGAHAALGGPHPHAQSGHPRPSGPGAPQPQPGVHPASGGARPPPNPFSAPGGSHSLPQPGRPPAPRPFVAPGPQRAQRIPAAPAGPSLGPPPQQSTSGGGAPPAPPGGSFQQPAGPIPAVRGPGIDPARAALDAALVATCTRVIADYRQQRLDKQSAVAQCYAALVAAQYDPADHLGTYLAQLDQHDAARAAAAAVGGAGGPQQAHGPPPGGDPVEKTRPRGRKRTRQAHTGRSTSPSSSDDNDDDNDDDDSYTARGPKRPSFDPKKAAFNDAALARDVPEHARLTLDARDNYCADLKAAKRYLMRAGRYPAFPDSLWEAVLADKPVDFDKILSSKLAISGRGSDHPVGPNGAYLHLPDARVVKTVSTRSDWEQCFNKWSKAVCFAYPHRVQELRVYGEFIARQFDSIHEDCHDRVINADIAIREEVSIDPSLSFFDKEELRDIGARYISPIGSEVYSRRAPAASSSPAKAKSGKSSRRRERCNRFNQGRCYSLDCKYDHTCSRPGCNGRHPEREHDESQKTPVASGSGNDRSASRDHPTRAAK